jgi:AcrR family transcriptional regulator
MLASVGRPKVHDQQTAALLLRRAERIVEAEGLPALSLRRLADETGVSSRAVYSLFGSKDGLVAALGARAFEWLGAAVAAAPLTDDAAADLVEAGANAFRRLATEHVALFQIGVQGSWSPEVCEPIVAAANDAWQHLLARTKRLEAANQLGSRSAQEAAVEFHAMCEGLAVIEIRGQLTSMTNGADAEAVWRRSLSALVAGFART